MVKTNEGCKFRNCNNCPDSKNEKKEEKIPEFNELSFAVSTYEYMYPDSFNFGVARKELQYLLNTIAQGANNEEVKNDR